MDSDVFKSFGVHVTKLGDDFIYSRRLRIVFYALIGGAFVIARNTFARKLRQESLCVLDVCPKVVSLMLTVVYATA